MLPSEGIEAYIQEKMDKLQKELEELEQNPNRCTNQANYMLVKRTNGLGVLPSTVILHAKFAYACQEHLHEVSKEFGNSDIRKISGYSMSCDHICKEEAEH